MSFQNLLLAITVLVAANAPTRAQDDPSQRMLPLPQRELPGLEQQMELLKRLRSLIESRQQQEPVTAPDAANPSSSTDPRQIEQLRNALQNIQEQLPAGFVPPDLSSVPPEQLRKAIENPAVQQQMRDLLKQFSKDGVLPPSGSRDGTNPPLPGLPPASMQSLQDFLKKLAEDPTPNETPQNPAVTEPPRPRPLRKKEYNSPPNQPRPNDVPSEHPVPESHPRGAETPVADPLLPPTQSPPNQFPGTSPNPRMTKPGTANPGIINPRNTEPAAQPPLAPSDTTPNVDNTNAESQQRALKALQDLIEEISDGTPTPDSQSNSQHRMLPDERPRPNTGNSDSSGNTGSRSDLPSVSEFLQEQLKKMNLSPGSSTPGPRSAEDRSAGSPQNPPGSNPTARPKQETPRGSAAQTPPAGTKPAPDRTSPPMDIQKELERSGFGGTLKKIVDKARKESRQPKPAGNDSITPNGTAGANPQDSPGLEQSMIRMLDGMKDDLAEIAKENKFNEPSRRPEPRRPDPTPRRDSGTQSDSALNKIRKAAGDLFSGRPESPQRNTPSGGSSASLSTPALESQFDLTPVAVLAGLIAAVAAGFFGLRFLKLRAAISTSVGHTAAPIAPAEIQNRADVIRAFHEFAMRSTKSVQSWWTHRAVERVIVTASPEKKAAVETLTNAYEQARYLPQELELSTEQMHLTRIALQQCANGVPA